MSRHLRTISAMALCIAVPQFAGATTYTREEAVKIAYVGMITMLLLVFITGYVFR